MRYEFFAHNEYYPLGDGVNLQPHYKPVDMIRVFVDDRTQLVNPIDEYLNRMDIYIQNGTVTDEEKEGVVKNYKAFKNGKPLNIEGSILKECPLLTQSDIDVLNYKQIYTLEQFAALTDTTANSLGFGFFQLKQKVKLFLDSKNDTNLISGLANQNDALKAQLTQQAEQISQLMAMQAQANVEALASKKSK